MDNVTNSPPSRNSHSAVDAPESEAGKIERLRQQLAEQNRQLEQIRQDLQTLLTQRDEARNLSLDEAAELAGVSKRKLEELIHAGEVPSLKIGRRRLVPYRAFKAWLRRKAES